MKAPLESVLPNGKPVPKETTKYSLVNPTLLAWNAQKALDKGEEETFSDEVEVLSTTDGETIKEVYAARFTRHASWGLKADLYTNEHGKFALWLEFVRDADEG